MWMYALTTQDLMQPLHWQVGAVQVTRIVELTTASLGPHLLPQATPERMLSQPWLEPFVDAAGKLILSMHALVLQSQGQLIVVDTCIGNDKERSYPRWNHMQSDFLQRFREQGFAPEDVDVVLCTHMHVDHVGWNTQLVAGQWQPTFPNARYLYAKDEWEHWRHEDQEYGPVFADSVQPVFDAGLADLVESTHQVNAEISLEPTPGHTPGHVCVSIRSQDERAIITGDMIHHPCQIQHPEWSSTADTDAQLAQATRSRFVERFGDADVLVIGTHFATPTAGRIVQGDDGYWFDVSD